MRLTDFWERMDAVFGAGYSRSWARDQVLSGLAGRTVQEALDEGLSAKRVWAAVVAQVDVPARLR